MSPVPSRSHALNDPGVNDALRPPPPPPSPPQLPTLSCRSRADAPLPGGRNEDAPLPRPGSTGDKVGLVGLLSPSPPPLLTLPPLPAQCPLPSLSSSSSSSLKQVLPESSRSPGLRPSLPVPGKLGQSRGARIDSELRVWDIRGCGAMRGDCSPRRDTALVKGRRDESADIRFAALTGSLSRSYLFCVIEYMYATSETVFFLEDNRLRVLRGSSHTISTPAPRYMQLIKVHLNRDTTHDARRVSLPHFSSSVLPATHKSAALEARSSPTPTPPLSLREALKQSLKLIMLTLRLKID